MCKPSIKPIVSNLESLFSKFNEQFYNNELQMPVITVSPDTTKGAYGWCTGWKAWKANESEGYYEINMCAEHLARSFTEVAETLLHEMVHLYNLQHDIKDTSRSGTYHNAKYKASAEQHGLSVKKSDKYGWSDTSLDDEAKAFINSIDMDFELYRESPLKVGKSAAKQSTRKYVCPVCGCIVRATKEVHIICYDCETEFVEEAS